MLNVCASQVEHVHMRSQLRRLAVAARQRPPAPVLTAMICSLFAFSCACTRAHASALSFPRRMQPHAQPDRTRPNPLPDLNPGRRIECPTESPLPPADTRPLPRKHADVGSAMSLTVLNQYVARTARRYAAPIGTVTGIGRGVFAVAFGLAPAATIALYAAAPWLPLVTLATAAALSGLAFGSFIVRRREDLVPPVRRRTCTDADAPPAPPGSPPARPAFDEL